MESTYVGTTLLECKLQKSKFYFVEVTLLPTNLHTYLAQYLQNARVIFLHDVKKLELNFLFSLTVTLKFLFEKVTYQVIQSSWHKSSGPEFKIFIQCTINQSFQKIGLSTKSIIKKKLFSKSYYELLINMLCIK